MPRYLVKRMFPGARAITGSDGVKPFGAPVQAASFAEAAASAASPAGRTGERRGSQVTGRSGLFAGHVAAVAACIDG